MNDTAIKLFEFVRDMIYDPDAAMLDTGSLDPDFRDLGEGLTVLANMLFEQRHYAEALSRGDMSTAIPSRDNELASPLKALHASLRHITWQTQRVAAGDYQQKIDFMGDFAESFNSMVRELAAHKRLMDYQIESSERQNKALANSVALFSQLTKKIPQPLLVISVETQEILFSNAAADDVIARDVGLLNSLISIMMRDLMSGSGVMSNERSEIESGEGADTSYYSVHRYHIQWSSHEAVAFIAEDVTKERLNTMKLERLANVDELTKTFVRRHGMELFEQWISEGRCFALCFIDLDFLKYTNDTFGHEIGDFYITTAADLLTAFAPNTVVARLGGDEFMMLVPDLSEAQIMALMGQLEQDLAAAPQKLDAPDDVRSQLKFHASFGIVPVEADCSASASDLLAEADKRMYEYKMAHKAARRA